jgi:putative PIN family toxin of toxin-antitoxin system
VVLDTNVYISLFTRPENPLFEIWRQACSGSFVLMLSPVIVRELGRVLRERFFWSETAIVKLIKLLTRVGEIVTPPAIPEVISADPDDNHILTCALSGKADLIVSGDHHVLRLKEYAGIAIVRPADLLHTLAGFER